MTTTSKIIVARPTCLSPSTIMPRPIPICVYSKSLIGSILVSWDGWSIISVIQDILKDIFLGTWFSSAHRFKLLATLVFSGFYLITRKANGYFRKDRKRRDGSGLPRRKSCIEGDSQGGARASQAQLVL